jgi:hypothetical protein
MACGKDMVVSVRNIFSLELLGRASWFFKPNLMVKFKKLVQTGTAIENWNWHIVVRSSQRRPTP